MSSTMHLRSAFLVLLGFLLTSLSAPAALSINAKSAILVDANTGKFL